MKAIEARKVSRSASGRVTIGPSMQPWPLGSDVYGDPPSALNAILQDGATDIWYIAVDMEGLMETVRGLVQEADYERVA